MWGLILSLRPCPACSPLPEGPTWVMACSHCLHTSGAFTVVFKWLFVPMQGPGPLLAGAQFGTKWCLWKCPGFGLFGVGADTEAKNNVTASCLHQGAELPPFLSGNPPLSVDAAHNKCGWQQSMTSAALSRGSGSNTALQLGRPQSVKNTAVPKPKPSVELWSMLLWYPWQAQGWEQWLGQTKRSVLELSEWFPEF